MNEVLDTPVEELDLSLRAYNILMRNGLMTVRQLLPLGEEDLLALRNLGRRAYEEIAAKLAERGFTGPAPTRGPDEPDGPDDPHESGDRVPRDPSPGGFVAAAEAAPEPETCHMDARSTAL